MSQAPSKAIHLAIALTVMLAGRAMTLAYLHRAGGQGTGDPPAAWLMPLVGDALIGVSALGIAALLWRQRGLWSWVAIVVWNALGIWDAMSAFLVHLTVPWSDFFMVQIFGSSMFFAASAMHIAIIAVVVSPEVRGRFFSEHPVAQPA